MLILKNSFSLLVFIFLCNIIQAQVSKNSLWAIETNNNVNTFKKYSSINIDNIRCFSSSNLLKPQYSFNKVEDKKQTLAQKIHEAYKKGNLTAYKDAALTQPYAYKDLKTFEITDTVIVFDPKTYEEETKIVKSTFLNSEIYSYKIHQVIYYDEQHQQFKTIPTAIAPLVGNNIPLFWLPVDNDFSMDDSNITWVKRVSYPVSLETGKIIKAQQILPQVWENLITHIKQNNTEIYNREDKMNTESIQNIGNAVDTLIVFDPETFEADTTIVRNELNYDNIRHLQIIQDWGWNEKNNKIHIKSVGFSPISSTGKGTKTKPILSYYLFTKYE